MINGFKLPRGVCDIFKMNECNGFRITENYNHRTDRILEFSGNSSVEMEILTNNLNNVSPISIKKNDTYLIMGNRFYSYFGRI